jgi:hypothetical protein
MDPRSLKFENSVSPAFTQKALVPPSFLKNEYQASHKLPVSLPGSIRFFSIRATNLVSVRGYHFPLENSQSFEN